ncbi:MAG TPA: hypothetical protein VFC78_22535 [Tepidisphaeraceae bacterium]|nr:hypothetical protein [Tepidisphaeraceae bacterium]
MEYTSQQAVRQVLKEAGEHDRFFDFSDAERLTWMIERAYELGRSEIAARTAARSRNLKPSPCLPKHQTSR